MRINQLVRVWLPALKVTPEKTLLSRGQIGVITRILETRVEVRFTEEDFYKFKFEQIVPVDISESFTVSFSELRRRSITNNFDNFATKVILGNEVKEYVGIGWVLQNYVTEKDLALYPRVVDDEEHRLHTLGKSYGI
jgi:hypothetical protein